MKHVGKGAPSDVVQLGLLVTVHFTNADGAVRSGPVTLMVDTGARSTMVDEAIPSGLGLAPFGCVDVVGVSGKPEERPLYEMTMILGMLAADGTIHDAVFTTPIASMPSMHHPTCQGLLGRDFLAHMRLTYDGQSGTFEIAHPSSIPASRGARQGPNDRCSCGSGKKFKKCHGAPGRPPSV